jgi:hypothetical protein
MFFAGWDLPAFDKLVEHVAHGTALDLLDAVREELEDTFTAYANDGEWDYATAWEGEHNTQITWAPASVEGMWEGGFPVEITLEPINFTAAFITGLKAHEGQDGTIIGTARTELLASLNAWRRAIDEAEAALNAHP